MIRNYRDEDYKELRDLYEHGEWYGGQFDEARDSRERLAKKVDDDPESIWVYQHNGELQGTISLIEDGRVAWLFRFAVKDNDRVVAKELYDKAVEIFKKRGHSQVLVYSPVGNEKLDDRYKSLGMNKGHDLTAYWQDI